MSVLSTTELERLLAEDAPFGDLTTESLGIGRQPGRICFAARSAMVVAGIDEARSLLNLAGVQAQVNVHSGREVAPGATLLVGEGEAGSLHRAWKVAQTLMEVWSGVASATRELVTAARVGRADIVIACTRKNLPGTKAMAVAAVKAGGGVMHRHGLSETVLVFPQHRAFRPRDGFAELVRELRSSAPEKKLVVEVMTIEEGMAAAEAGFDVVQTEKFQAGEVAELVSRVRPMTPRPVVVAAGGINPVNAAAYARAGADVLATSWPFTAKPADVVVTIAPR